MTYSIVPIVEGYAEVESVPVLMRRLIEEGAQYYLQVGKPVRVNRYQIVKRGELERRVQLAMTRPNCMAIMVILDADDDCPKELAPALLSRANQVSQGKLVSVVIPKSELESWFVGSIESLRGVRGISNDASTPTNPEDIRDAKGFLTCMMIGHRHYLGVDDQPAFAESFDMARALGNCRSFRKFSDDFRRIVELLPQT